MDRVRHPERAVAVPPGALVGHQIPMAADPRVGDAVAGAVDREEVIDAAWLARTEQMPDTTEVAWSLLADGADEEDRPGSPHVRIAQTARDRENHREATAIVADARSGEPRHGPRHLHAGAFRKNRVEVAGKHHDRPIAGDAALADDVALAVDAHVAKAERLEPALELLAAALLLEWRR